MNDYSADLELAIYRVAGMIFAGMATRGAIGQQKDIDDAVTIAIDLQRETARQYRQRYFGDGK